MNLITIQTLKTGEVARSFMTYETLEDAVGALYQTLASSVIDNKVSDVLTIIMNDQGRIMKQDGWKRSDIGGKN